VCQRLPELRRGLSGYAAQFDAALLSAADARVVLGHAAAMEHLAATIKALAAARISDTGANPAERSAAHEIARVTGTSVGSARRSLEIGRRLARQPDVAASARRGELSQSQLDAITDAATADPTAAKRLVEQAKTTSLSDLQDDCARTKAAARPDPEIRRQQIRRARRLHSWSDTEGVWQLRGNGNPEDGAQVDAALDALANQLFHEARQSNEPEPRGADLFDALVRLATEANGNDNTGTEPHEGACQEGNLSRSPAGASPPPSSGRQDETASPASGGPTPAPNPSPGPQPGAVRRASPAPSERARAVEGGLSNRVSDVPTRATGRRASRPRRRRGAQVKLLLRVDYDAWLRGTAAPGETCELVGYGPVAVSVVRDLIDTGDAFVAAILTKTHAVAGVAHLGRRPNAHQQSALEWLYPSCAAEGCPARAHLQTDHRTDWAKTRFTALDLLDRLCTHHHNLKTRQNWQLVNGHGKRAFVAPDDPRHPRHQPQAPRPRTYSSAALL
jgi:hypothetical protein